MYLRINVKAFCNGQESKILIYAANQTLKGVISGVKVDFITHAYPYIDNS